MSSLRALGDAALIAALRALYAPGAPQVDEAGLCAELRGRLVAVPVPGGVVTVDLGDWTSLLVVRMGGWEPHLARLARAVVRPGDVAVDAGAHVGAWTVLLASLVGEAGRVLAYEPHPVNAARVRAAAGALATVEEAALGEAEGEATLAVRGDGMLGSLAAAGAGPRVRITTVDAAGLPRVDFFKIDTEGWELAVLRGARATLARSDATLLVELHAEELAAAGLGVGDVTGELAAQGYAALDIVPSGDRLIVRPLPAGTSPTTHHLLARRDPAPFEVGLL